MVTKAQARKNLKKAAKLYNESVRQPVDVELQEEHIAVISRALEVYQRLRMGQIKYALDEAFDYRIDYEAARSIEVYARNLLFPDLECNQSWGIYNQDKVGDATLAYEIYKTFKQYQYFKRTDGWLEYHNVSADGPVGDPNSKIPYPVIKNFSTKKFFPIPKRQQKKAFDLFTEEKYSELWDLVKKHMKDLPRGSSYNIDCHFDTVGVYVDKPEKDTKISWEK